MPKGEWVSAHRRDEYESDTGVIGYRGPNPSGHKWHGHMPAATIKEQLGEPMWSDYFKFCVVRDPFDKAVSAFHFAEHVQDRLAGVKKLAVKITRFFHGASPEKRFKKWLASGKFYVDRDKYMIDGEVCIDYFIRFEDLSGGIQHVCEVIGEPFEPERLTVLKGGVRPKGKNLSAYYDKESIEIIAKQFAWEIEKFGYEPPKVT